MGISTALMAAAGAATVITGALEPEYTGKKLLLGG